MTYTTFLFPQYILMSIRIAYFVVFTTAFSIYRRYFFVFNCVYIYLIVIVTVKGFTQLITE